MNTASSGAQDYSSTKNIVSRFYPIVEKTLPRTARNWARKQFFTPLPIKFRKKELEFLKTSKASFLPFNDKQIAVYEWGKGKTIVLQHGWAGKGVQFIEIIKELTKNGYHVVAIDAPSHGHSTGKWTSAFEFIELINFLTHHFVSIHAFVGHSMGGLVLLNVLALGERLNKVIIINTPTKSESVMNAFLGVIGGSSKTGEFIRSFVLDKYDVPFNSLFTPKILPEQSEKVLVIHDRKDRQVGFDTIEVTKELLPNARFYFTEGLGHTRILYDKGVAAKIVSEVSL
jgi:hypothetical protein